MEAASVLKGTVGVEFGWRISVRPNVRNPRQTCVSAASLSVVFEAEACIAGIVSTELSLSISQQDCSDVRVAFPTEGGLRTVRHNQGQLDTGAMSTLGTTRTFSALWG